MDGLIEIMTEVDAMKSFRFADINEIMWWLRETAPTFGHVIKVDTAWSMMKIHRIKKLTSTITLKGLKDQLLCHFHGHGNYHCQKK